MWVMPETGPRCAPSIVIVLPQSSARGRRPTETPRLGLAALCTGLPFESLNSVGKFAGGPKGVHAATRPWSIWRSPVKLDRNRRRLLEGVDVWSPATARPSECADRGGDCVERLRRFRPASLRPAGCRAARCARPAWTRRPPDVRRAGRSASGGRSASVERSASSGRSASVGRSASGGRGHRSPAGPRDAPAFRLRSPA